MESTKLSEIIRKYWDDNGWVPPSQEWAYKLAILLRDSMTLLKDSIDQSRPFFLIPTIQKEGQDFLENNDSKASLKLILNYLIEQNIIKLNKETALNEISEIFDLTDINKAGAKFSWEKLNWINSQYIKNMDSIKLREIIEKYWDDNGWVPPSQEWAYKLAILLRDSMTLLKDAIDQSKPFFLIPKIQKEGQDFLENRDSKLSLKLILNYLNEQNTLKVDKDKSKEIINVISKMHNIKKGILMKSLRVAFFGSLSGPDLIQSWELFSESKTDRSRIERCLKSI